MSEDVRLKLSQCFIRCQSDSVLAVYLNLLPRQQTFSQCVGQTFDPFTWESRCQVYESLLLCESMIILQHPGELHLFKTGADHLSG